MNKLSRSIYYNTDDLKDAIYGELLNGHFVKATLVYPKFVPLPSTLVNYETVMQRPVFNMITSDGKYIGIYDVLAHSSLDTTSLLLDLGNSSDKAEAEGPTPNGTYIFDFWSISKVNHSIFPWKLSCNTFQPVRNCILMSPYSKNDVLDNVVSEKGKINVEVPHRELYQFMQDHMDATLPSYDGKYHVLLVVGVFNSEV